MANRGNHCNTLESHKMDTVQDQDSDKHDHHKHAGNPGNQAETFHFNPETTFEQM